MLISRRRWLSLGFLGGLGWVSGCGTRYLNETTKRQNQIYKEILQHEDRRDFAEAAFWRDLLDTRQEPATWERAILALGRIGDARALPLLEPYAQRDPAVGAHHPSNSSAVREQVAFAIGEIEDRETRETVARPMSPQAFNLLLKMTADTAWRVRARAVEALGKTASTIALPTVVSVAFHPENMDPEASRVLTGLGLTALFRIGGREALAPALELVEHPDPEIRWQAANAVYRLLLRTPDNQTERVNAVMRPRLVDRAPMVRGYAARALGATKDPSAAGEVLPLLDDPDFFVQIEAVNALARLKSPAAADRLIAQLTAWLETLRRARASLKPQTYNLAIAIVQALGEIGDRKAEGLLNRLRYRLDPVSNAAEIAAAKILKGQADFFGRHIQHIIEVRGYWMRFNTPESLRAAVTALGEHGSDAALQILRDIMEQENESAALVAKVRPAILQAMTKLNPPDLEAILRRHLSDADDVTRRTAAEELARLKDRGPVSAEVPAALAAAYATSSSQSTPETRRAIVDALTKFDESPQAQNTLKQALKDPSQIVRIRAIRYWAPKAGAEYATALGVAETHLEDSVYMLVASGRRNLPRAIMETTRGIIEIELFPEDAPLTVHNFKQLAEQGFFHDLTFMRVVANFVVQSGDPRNDMEGGPGYTIRCEINKRPYLRGSVGMALSGKDTGGSQFFISLTPQPHLDGGYTVFGRVISGMDIADNLLPGDKILDVHIREIFARMDTV